MVVKLRDNEMVVLRSNGPELSCGGEQPPQSSSLRGRFSQMLLSSSNNARQNRRRLVPSA